MFRSGIVRVVVLGALCLAGVFFLIQFYGMSDGNAVAASADQAAPQGQVANIQIDWAVVGLVGAGVVVMLLRPRRRVQTK